MNERIKSMYSDVKEHCAIIPLVEDVFFNIFSFLIPEDLFILFFVSKQLKHMASLDVVWKAKFERHYGNVPAKNLPLNNVQEGEYCRFFVRAYQKQNQFRTKLIYFDSSIIDRPSPMLSQFDAKYAEMRQIKKRSEMLTLTSRLISIIKENDVESFEALMLEEIMLEEIVKHKAIEYFNTIDINGLSILDWLEKTHQQSGIDPQIWNKIFTLFGLQLKNENKPKMWEELICLAIRCHRSGATVKRLIEKLKELRLKNPIDNDAHDKFIASFYWASLQTNSYEMFDLFYTHYLNENPKKLLEIIHLNYGCDLDQNIWDYHYTIFLKIFQENKNENSNIDMLLASIYCYQKKEIIDDWISKNKNPSSMLKLKYCVLAMQRETIEVFKTLFKNYILSSAEAGFVRIDNHVSIFSMSWSMLTLLSKLYDENNASANEFGDVIYNNILIQYTKNEKINVNAKDESGRTILHWAAICRRKNQVFRDLISKGEQLSEMDSGCQTPIDLIAEYGLVDTYQFLVQNYDLKSRYGTKYDETLLYKASLHNRYAMVKALLENKVSIDEIIYKRISPGFDIVYNQVGGYPEDNSSDDLPDESDEDRVGRDGEGNEVVIKITVGQTALCAAAYCGHFAIVELLVEHKAVYMNLKNFKGYTPVVRAIQGGHLDIVKYFLPDQASYDAYKTQNHKKIGILASQHPQIFNYLIQYDKDLLVDTKFSDAGKMLNGLDLRGVNLHHFWAYLQSTQVRYVKTNIICFNDDGKIIWLPVTKDNRNLNCTEVNSAFRLFLMSTWRPNDSQLKKERIKKLIHIIDDNFKLFPDQHLAIWKENFSFDMSDDDKKLLDPIQGFVENIKSYYQPAQMHRDEETGEPFQKRRKTAGF